MARFMREIREAFPGEEIVHNQRYHFGGGLSRGVPRSEHVRAAIQQADLIEVEGGYADPGLVPGNSRFGWDTLRSWIPYIHAQGRGIVQDQWNGPPEYALATYLMDATGRDFIGHGYRRRPTTWWREGWELDLGSARGGAFADQGVIRRDFERGTILVRKPGSATAPVAIGDGYERLDGTPVGTLVTVAERDGLVLRRVSRDRPRALLPAPRSIRSRRARRSRPPGGAPPRRAR